MRAGRISAAIGGLLVVASACGGATASTGGPKPTGSTTPLPTGTSTIVADFAYDGGGPGKGGTLTITVNGKKVASGRIERTQCCIFSADEGVDVGEDGETAVSNDYPQHDNAFTGTLKQVKVELIAPSTTN